MAIFDDILNPEQPQGEGKLFDDVLAKPAEPGFFSTMKRTGGQMLSGLGTTVEDIAGPGAVSGTLKETGQGIVERNPAGITSLADIVESPWLTAKEAVGQMVPQIAAGIPARMAGAALGGAVAGPPGAVVGGVLGGLAPIFVQEYGGIREEQKQEGTEDIARAALAAAGATALERLGPEGRIISQGLGSVVPSPGRALREIGKQALKDTGVEAVTEAAQTGVEKVGAAKSPFTPEALEEAAVAGVMGGIGGGIVGGGHRAAQELFAKPQETPPAPPEPTPAERAGIDATSGPISSVAATALNTGASEAVAGQRADEVMATIAARQQEDQKLLKPKGERPKHEEKEPLSDDEILARMAGAAKAEKEAGTQLFPLATLDAATKRAETLSASTGQEHIAIPHPYVHNAFAVVPAPLDEPTSPQGNLDRSTADAKFGGNLVPTETARTEIQGQIGTPAQTAQNRLPGAATPASSNAATNKGAVDSLGGNAKLTGDLAQRKAAVVKPYSELDVEGKRVVQSAVLKALHDGEVFDSIVSSVPVQVVNNLIGRELTAKVTRKDMTVLSDRLSSNRDSEVATSFLAAVLGAGFHVGENNALSKQGPTRMGAYPSGNEGAGRKTKGSGVGLSKQEPQVAQASAQAKAPDVRRHEGVPQDQANAAQPTKDAGDVARREQVETLAKDPKWLTKRLSEARGVLTREALQQFGKGTVDLEQRRMVSDDGAMALQFENTGATNRGQVKVVAVQPEKGGAKSGEPAKQGEFIPAKGTPYEQGKAAAEKVAARDAPPKELKGPELKDWLRGYDEVMLPNIPKRGPEEGPAVSVRVDKGTIDEAAHGAATSATNALPQPTEPQKEAGNYQKGHYKIHGLDLSIENPQGSTRFGYDREKFGTLTRTALEMSDNDPMKAPLEVAREAVRAGDVEGAKGALRLAGEAGKKSGRGWAQPQVRALIDSFWSNELRSHYGYIRGTVGRDKDHIDAFVKPGTKDDHDGPIFVIDQQNEQGKFDEHKVMLGYATADEAIAAYHANYPAGWKGASKGIRELTPTQFKHWLKTGDTKKPLGDQPLEPATPERMEPAKQVEPEQQEGASAEQTEQIAEAFNEAPDEKPIHHLFDAPKKNDVVRTQDRVKVYVAKHGWMTVEEAKAKLKEWKDHVADQGEQRNANSDRVVLSFFDFTGEWSKPWEEAGYEVWRFDIQNDPEQGNVNNFSTGFFNDWFGDFEGKDIYAILSANPCTDFASSGARHFAAKDKDGRTVESVKLVEQTLAAIEHFKPAVWAIENPVGRIERLGGLPPWRLSFDPNHFGEPYTKKTLLWGRFNGELPIAPVEPTEGSKMWAKYGGKSEATKNARSVTPEGFAYSFFMANNAIDNPAMAIANKYDRLDRGLIERAVKAGVTEKQVSGAIDDFYYMDLDDKAAEKAIGDLIDGGLGDGSEPEGRRLQKVADGIWRATLGNVSAEGKNAIEASANLTKALKPKAEAILAKEKETSKPAAEEGPAGEFEKGARVELVGGHQLAGRHGTVQEKMVSIMRPVFGGGPVDRYVGYEVKTDNGVVTHANQRDVVAETARPERVVPDITYGGHTRTPEDALHYAANEKRSANNYRAAALRARLERKKREHLAEAARHDKSSEGWRQAFEFWATEYPDEAKAAREAVAPKGKPGVAAPAELTPGPPVETPAKFVYTETKHGKTGEPLFVVGLKARVESNEYTRLNMVAKQFSGYYSKFTKGFTFRSAENAQKFMAAEEGKKPAAPQAAPAPATEPAPTPGWTEIGKNALGQTVFEDARGVRSIVRDGIRRSEPVRFIPTRQGTQLTVDHKGEFLTVAEAPPAPTRFEYHSPPDWETPAETAAKRLVVDAMNGELSVDDLVTQLRNSGLPAGTLTAITERLDDRMSAAQQHRMLAVGEYLTEPVKKGDPVLSYGASGAGNPIEGVVNKVYDGPAGEKLADLDTGETAVPVDNLLLNDPDASPILESEEPLHGEHPSALPSEEHGPASDAGPSPADVQRAPSERGAREGAEREGETLRPSLEPADQRSDDEGGDGGQTLRGGRGDVGERGPAGSGSGAGGSPGLPARRSLPRGVKDYHPEPGAIARSGSWRETARRNLDILELVHRLEAEGRFATREEQALLAQFTGWGASEIRQNLFPTRQDYQTRKPVFAPDYAREEWKHLVERAAALMTPEELDTALTSTQYAHYTSEEVVRSMWAGLERLGFKGGRILEPGMGTGIFAMLAPRSIMGHSSYLGIEREKLTAAIAKQLLPQQTVLGADYIKQALPNGYFDVAIGNPPFARTKILSDPAYARLNFSLHDYFFAKTLDKVRPGGLLVFITSRYTMDKQGDRARQYMAERADLLGAIRLPQTAFKQNAGTEVVTDVLFFQKRADGAARGGEPFLGLAEVTTPEGATLVNEYFAAHPEMVLGTHSLQGSMRFGGGREYTVLPIDESAIDAQFAQAVAALPENVYAKATPKEVQRQTFERDLDPKIKKEGGLYVGEDGHLYRREHGTGRRVEELKNLSPAKIAWLKSYVGLRDAMKQARYDQINEGDWEASLKALNKAYESFKRKHGPLLDYSEREKVEVDEDGEKHTVVYRIYKNETLFRLDVESPLVRALEKIDNGGNIVKGTFLLGRSLKRPAAPKIETTHDALLVSLSDHGRLDLPHIAQLRGLTVESIIDELGDAIYKNPAGDWETADQYLSGNVVQKLEEARAAAQTEPAYERNVDALYKSQPVPLTARDVTIGLGSPWIPTTDIDAFASEALEINVVTGFNAALGQWDVPGSSQRGRRGSESEWGTPRRSPFEILDAALNNKTFVIRDEVDDGKTVVNPEASAAANEKVRLMKEAFARWVWTDAGRAGRLLEEYNQRFNNLAPRKFDGAHLTLPGLSLRWQQSLHPHQKRAIWRQIQTGNVYLAHAVGAGKTMEMIIGGMEQRRLGLIQKPMYVVPNHMLQQFSNEFLDAYPGADIMVADEHNFKMENRRAFIGQAAANNPDAIIITHSAFQKIAPPAEATKRVLDRLTDELRSALDDLDKNDRRTRSQIEGRIEQLQQRFGGKTSGTKDQVVNLAEMGVDYLYIDEAHEFRKLDFVTNLNNVKGITPEGSQRALDLYIKIKALEEINPGRSHTFGSGTPITNTLGELYSLQRFMDEDELYRLGLQAFDSWASQFGQVVKFDERNAAGRYEVVERFAKFVNVPEVMSRARQFMDVLTMSALGDLVQRPAVNGGEPQVVVTPPSDGLKAYMDHLNLRIKISRDWKPSKEEPGNPDPLINIITDARLAALDLRYVANARNDPQSKLNKMVDKIIEKHNELKDAVYTDPATGKADLIRGAAQIVFSAVGFGEQVAENRGFDVRGAIMKRLKDAGIPAAQVAWMSDYKTHAKKEAMFRDMREGRVKILFGSPKNMGTGLNVQRRLAALHYLAPPWYPADVEQPHGRILRQGNLNKNVDLLWYATEGTYDSTQWQMIARKARFIEQALSGDNSVRNLEDVSESSLYEQASALASGDTRVIEYTRLLRDIESLETLERAHVQEQIGFQRERDDLTYRIRSTKARIAQLKAAEEVGGGDRTYSSTSRAKIRGVAAESYSEIGKLLHAEAQRAALAWEPTRQGESAVIPIGTISTTADHHFAVAVSLYTQHPKKKAATEAKIQVTIGPIKDHTNVVNLDETPTPQSLTGLAAQAFNTISDITNSRYRAESGLEEYKERYEALTKRIGTPFPRAQELLDAIARAAQLRDELMATGTGLSEEALDELIASTRWEGEGGRPRLELEAPEAVYSLGRPGAMSATAVDATITPIRRQWRNAPRIRVVQSVANLPFKLDPNARPAGVFKDGLVWLIADNIRDASVAQHTLLHEVIGHYGLRGLFGTQLDGLLARIYQTNPDVKAAANRLIDEYAARGMKLERALATEEALADMAGDRGMEQVSGWKLLVAAIRNALRKLGFDLAVSDADITALLAASRRYVTERAPAPAPTRAAPAFATGPALWYSTLRNVFRGAKQSPMPGKQWTAWLSANASKLGIKADEIQWSGINEWLALQPGKVSKEDIASYLARNGVRVEETMLGGDVAPMPRDRVIFEDGDTGSRSQIHAVESITSPESAYRQKVDAGKAIWMNDNEETISTERATEIAQEWERYWDSARPGARADKLAVRLTALGFTPEYDYEGPLASIRRNSDGVEFTYIDRGEPGIYGDQESVWSSSDPTSREEDESAEILTGEVAEVATELGRARDEVANTDTDEAYGGTRYHGYTLPGGKDYRELLLTLPTPAPTPLTQLPDGYEAIADQSQPREQRFGVIPPGQVHARPMAGRHATVEAALQEALRLVNQQRLDEWTRNNAFRSSHFDQPNILAHIRFNERTDAEGKRVLFIEEIQSDWAQKGRRDGFYGNLTKEDAAKMYWGKSDQEWAALPEAERQYAMRNMSGRGKMPGAPLAPFVGKTESWVGLTLKRMIRYGSEHGFDRIAWTTGEQQAERYSLSKQVRKIEWWPIVGTTAQDVSIDTSAGLVRFIVDGGKVITERSNAYGLTGKPIEDVIGKEAAKKIAESHSGTLEGEGLKIGGEGMISFYNRIVPQVANDLLKKLGGEKVGTVALPGVFGDRPMFPSQQPGFDLTDALRAKALEGMPLFSLGDRSLIGQATQIASDWMRSPRQFNAALLPFQTQYHKAQINPWFRPVFLAAQAYLRDVSRFATDAADRAPNLLPRLGKLAEALKLWGGPDQKDVLAAGKATFLATLADRRLTPAQLRQGLFLEITDYDGAVNLVQLEPLTEKQIGLFMESRKAIDLSLEQVAGSEMWKLGRAELEYLRKAAGNDPSLMPRANALGRVLARAKDSVRSAGRLITAELERQATAAMQAGQEEEAERVAMTIVQIEKVAERVQELKANGYAPLTRFGRYTVNVYEMVDGQPVERYFSMFESKRDMYQREREMRELYPNGIITTGTMNPDQWKLYQGLTIDAVAAFANATGANEDVLFQEFYKLALSSRSALKHLIHRKGIAGYSEDLQRVLAGFVTSTGRLASKNLHFGEMTQAAQAIPKQYGDVAKEATNLIDFVQNPVEEASRVRSLLFVQFLGGSIAAALTNMTQPVMMTLPYLSQYGGPHAAGLELMRAVKAGETPADPALRAALERAGAEGVTDPQELYQLYAESIRGLGSQLWVRKGLRIWGSMFTLAETFNRRVTFIAAWRMAQGDGLARINEAQRAKGRPAFTDAYDFAEHAVEETQGIYNRGNRPNIARGAIGATVFTFRQFSIAYLEFFSRLPRREKLLMGALLIAAAGLQGAPGADDLEDLIDTIGQLLGFNTNSKEALRNWARNYLGAAGNVLLHGISGLPGMPLDVQGRLGLGNIIPGTALFKRSEGDKTRDAAEFAGPIGGVFQQMANAYTAAVAGHPQGAMQALAPTAIRNAWRGVDMWAAGIYKDTKGRKVIDTTKAEALIKGIGIQPESVAEASRLAQSVRQDIAMTTMVESGIADRWARAILDNDPEGVRKAIGELHDWNTRNPDWPIRITPAQIRARVMAAKMERSTRLTKSAPPEVRGMVLRGLATQ